MILNFKVLIGAFIDLAMFLPLILLAFLFRKTRKYHTKYERLKKTFQSLTGKDFKNKGSNIKTRNEKFSFPFCFKIILFTISILGMIASVFFTILKGLEKSFLIRKK
jgi:hypothetical protein